MYNNSCWLHNRCSGRWWPVCRPNNSNHYRWEWQCHSSSRCNHHYRHGMAIAKTTTVVIATVATVTTTAIATIATITTTATMTLTAWIATTMEMAVKMAATTETTSSALRIGTTATHAVLMCQEFTRAQIAPSSSLSTNATQQEKTPWMAMAGQATRKIVPRATGRVCVDVLVQQRQVKRNADNNQDQARRNQQNNRF